MPYENDWTVRTILSHLLVGNQYLFGNCPKGLSEGILSEPIRFVVIAHYTRIRQSGRKHIWVAKPVDLGLFANPGVLGVSTDPVDGYNAVVYVSQPPIRISGAEVLTQSRYPLSRRLDRALSSLFDPR